MEEGIGKAMIHVIVRPITINATSIRSDFSCAIISGC